MKNHYTALVQSGFLSRAKKQLTQANSLLKGDYSVDMDEEFVWYFDQKEKALDFDELYNTLNISEFVEDAYEEGLEDTDVIFINSPGFLILCGAKKNTVYTTALDQYEQEGIMPYYFTKRKVNGRIIWFCLAWLIIPFSIPCYN